LTTIKSSNPDWITEKKIKIIAQFGTTKHRDLPDVPLLLDYVKNPEDHAALDLYLSRQATDKPYLAPPGTPPDRLAILRKAFHSAVNDPGFVSEANRIGLEVDSPMSGEDLSAFVLKASRSSPAAARRVSEILAAFAGR
jgi:hypothetical protein